MKKLKDNITYVSPCFLYVGLTFDVIKQSPTFQNGLFTDSNQTGIRWGSTGRPTGGRYRYLDDENNKDSNRYFYLDENSYKTSNTRYRGERTEHYINGAIVAQSTANYGAEYFSTDLLGSIRTTTDSYGTSKNTVSYDAFGSLIEGSLNSTTDHGYLAKQHDPTTSLYNYGYRDYKPQSSRFNTVDPIRDGSNWFTYCNGDPIDFVDLWGLDTVDSRKVYGKVDPKEIKGEFALISVSKSKGTIDVYESRDKSGQHVDKVAGFEVVTNVQQEVPNNEKVSDTTRQQKNGTHPTQLPNGIYEISNERCPESEDGKYGTNNQGLYINASQVLIDSNGKEVVDMGYEVHITPWDYTDGCVGIKYELGNEKSKKEAEYKQSILNSTFRESQKKGYKTYIQFND